MSVNTSKCILFYLISLGIEQLAACMSVLRRSIKLSCVTRYSKLPAQNQIELFSNDIVTKTEI